MAVYADASGGKGMPWQNLSEKAAASTAKRVAKHRRGKMKKEAVSTRLPTMPTTLPCQPMPYDLADMPADLRDAFCPY